MGDAWTLRLEWITRIMVDGEEEPHIESLIYQFPDDWDVTRVRALLAENDFKRMDSFGDPLPHR